ncbi:hypothetical protein DFH08DRAFT_820285 [Mycena albidolilacea]|uniref:Uncharacterized protein n=1 Tax=Mycena albidolilacea TaxID=1033008 RepID=A0AAD7EE63_9AGAR|nr:hypothetical protein DFH08DRAFT_820285 [Mycena albidolilacea]
MIQSGSEQSTRDCDADNDTNYMQRSIDSGAEVAEQDNLDIDDESNYLQTFVGNDAEASDSEQHCWDVDDETNYPQTSVAIPRLIQRKMIKTQAASTVTAAVMPRAPTA